MKIESPSLPVNRRIPDPLSPPCHPRPLQPTLRGPLQPSGARVAACSSGVAGSPSSQLRLLTHLDSTTLSQAEERGSVGHGRKGLGIGWAILRGGGFFCWAIWWWVSSGGGRKYRRLLGDVWVMAMGHGCGSENHQQRSRLKDERPIC